MRFAYGETVTVSRPGGQTRYGDPLPAVEHTITGCGVAPRSSAEAGDRRSTVITGLMLYAPAGADIRAVDTITRPDGTRWAVDGDVGAWRSPLSGWNPGVEVALRRVSG